MSELLSPDEMAQIRNHEIQRALIVAQCRAGDELAVLCLMEDFDAKESGKAHILRESVWKLITEGTDSEVKRLWKVRKSLADTITATENQKLEEVDAALSLSPDVPSLVEGSAAVYAYWKEMCTEAFISSVASEGSLPDDYKVRLRESWFDLFRLAFREELGINDRAGMEYLVDSFDRIGDAIGASRDEVEKRFNETSQSFDRIDRKLNGLRSVLNNVRELLTKRSDTNGLSEPEFESGIDKLQDGYTRGLEGLQGNVSKEAARTRTVIREGIRELKEDLEEIKKEVREQRGVATAADLVFSLPPAPFCTGREAEIDQVSVNIVGHAISAVLGGPGIGKSTVSLAAVRDARVDAAFGERRAWIRCEQAPAADLLRQQVAQATGLPLTLSWPELRSALAGKPTLLVFDNFETSWEGDDGRGVEEQILSLASGKGLHLLLGIRGVECPPSITECQIIGPLEGVGARTLFRKHAKSIEVPDGELDTWLALEMEGLPLAIELVAKQARHSGSFSGLQRRWASEKTKMLRAGRGEGRLDSLEVSLALSTGRLTKDALRMAGVLGMLPAGLASEDLEILGQSHSAASELHSAGLVLVESRRFRALAPVREYFLSTLTPDASDREACLAHFTALGEKGSEVGGPAGAEAILRLTPELPNIESALLEALADNPPVCLPFESVVSASIALAEALLFTGIGSVRPVQAAVRNCKEINDLGRLANCIFALGKIHSSRCQYDEAKDYFKRALSLYQEVGGLTGEANCTYGLGYMHYARSEHEKARGYFEEAIQLYQKVEDIGGEANCIYSLGDILHNRSQQDEAISCFEKAFALYEIAENILGKAHCIYALGDIHRTRSQHDEARDCFALAIPLFRDVGDITGLANCIFALGESLSSCSELDKARACFEQAIQLFHEVGDISGEANCIFTFGKVHSSCSQHDEAQICFEKALSLYLKIGNVLGQANCFLAYGDIHFSRSQYNEARDCFEKAIPLYQEVGNILGEAHCIDYLGNLVNVTGGGDPREKWQKALLLYTQIPDPYSMENMHSKLAKFTEGEEKEAR